MKLIFCMQISMKACYKLTSSQNNKFAMSLQYLKKEVRDEVDFLHTRLISTLWKSKFPTRGYYHY